LSISFACALKSSQFGFLLCQKLQLVGQRFSGIGSFGGLLMLFCRGCRVS